MAYLATQPYKGTRDFYPHDQRLQDFIFTTWRRTAKSFGYEEYNGPMLESFELYAAKTGEEIVNRQLYWLEDQGKRKLAIRPEMTPTLARMVAGKLHELPRPIRWFSIPNLWRYERPQRGRLREHWQLNVDVLGGDNLLADHEVLQVAWQVIAAFGGQDHAVVKINHRGLVDTVLKQLGMSTETAKQAVKVLDARAKIGEEAYVKEIVALGVPAAAQKSLDLFLKMTLDEASHAYPCEGVEHLKKLFKLLHHEGFVFDPLIMRGMDYYTGTVFEMYDHSPENPRALFGGGRYDNLIGLFGKDQLSGVGFGMGDVTVGQFLETHKLIPRLDSAIDVWIGVPVDSLLPRSFEIARELRSAGLRVADSLSVAGLGQHLKLASKHGAKIAVLLGENEMRNSEVVVKNLESGNQEIIGLKMLVSYLREHL